MVFENVGGGLFIYFFRIIGFVATLHPVFILICKSTAGGSRASSHVFWNFLK